jgi:Ca-activated chloride channel family protein
MPLAYLVGLALLVLALARPQTVFSRIRRSADAIAIEMVVDCSGSMQALDMSQRLATGVKYRTRLDVVKETFASFIAKRPDDLVGLITFAGYAATRAPLTGDHDALLHVLKGVETPSQVYDEQGRVINQEEMLTAIGDALATACARLEKAATKTRIVVLLSDGESNTGVIQPEEAMRLAAKMGVKVYTVGVGTSGRAPFMGRDMFGRQAIQLAEVTLDEDLLREIARTTSARYFNVRNPQGLEEALEDINRLEKTRIERDVFTQYRELFVWFLGAGAGVAALGSALNVLLARRIV